jgi:hypothetical protein
MENRTSNYAYAVKVGKRFYIILHYPLPFLLLPPIRNCAEAIPLYSLLNHRLPIERLRDNNFSFSIPCIAE